MIKSFWFKPFWLAIQFLSRLPTPHFQNISAKEMGASISWFPVVGLLIGLGLVAVAQLHVWLPDQVVAGLVLLFWIWSTGALHLDGLADMADGWLGGLGDHQRALEIMKDSRIGTGGGVALVALLILKWSLIIVLIEYQAWWFLLLAPMVGRITSIALMPVTRYVSIQGIAEEMFLHLKVWVVWTWVLFLGSGLVWLNPWLGLACLFAWWWMRWVMIRITGGMTGDTAGAMTEFMELVWLLVGVTILVNELPIGF